MQRHKLVDAGVELGRIYADLAFTGVKAEAILPYYSGLSVLGPF